MKDKSETFSKIGGVVVLVIILGYIGCADVTDRQKEGRKKGISTEKEIVEEKVILEMAAKYNAITDWKDKLKAGNLMTIHLQNALSNTDERPYLFFAEIDDMRKTGERYEVVFYSYGWKTSKLLPDIFWYLSCDESVSDRLMKETADWSQFENLFHRIAVVAHIDKVGKGSNMEEDSEGNQKEVNNITATGEILDYYLIEGSLLSLPDSDMTGVQGQL